MKAQTIEILAAVIALMVLPIIVWPLIFGQTRTVVEAAESPPPLVEMKVLGVNCTKTGINVRLTILSNVYVKGNIIITAKPYDYVSVNVEGVRGKGYAPLVIPLAIEHGLKVIDIAVNDTSFVVIYSYEGMVKGNVAKMISCVR